MRLLISGVIITRRGWTRPAIGERVHLSGWDERQIPGGQDSAFVTHQHLKLTIQHVNASSATMTAVREMVAERDGTLAGFERAGRWI
jgi:hypothetical protein